MVYPSSLWKVAKYATPKYTLWHEGYIELKAVEKKLIEENLSTLILA